MAERIRIDVGGWTHAPLRGIFHPPDLRPTSARLTSKTNRLVIRQTGWTTGPGN